MRFTGRTILFIPCVFLGLCLSAGMYSAFAQDAQYVLSPEEAAWHREDLKPWSLGFEVARDWRDLKIDGDKTDLDCWHLRTLLGFQPIEWLTLQGALGASEPKVGDERGDLGLSWSLRLRVNFLEHVLVEKPGMPRHILMRAGVMASVTHNESDFKEEGRIKWREWRVIPHLQYVIHQLRTGYQDSYEPASLSIRVGPMVSAISGDYRDGEIRDADVEEDRALGLYAGVDLLLASGISLGADAQVYARGDGAATFTVGYRF